MSGLRLGELVATLALAQDNAFGQPLESQLRSCLLAVWLCEAMGAPRALRDTVYWVALLRYVGCTGHAHEVATVFGDEIAIRAQTLVHDAANPEEVMRDVVAFATAAHPPEAREQVIAALHAGVHDSIKVNFSSGCEVGEMLTQRLNFGPEVRDALRHTFERWNGHGFPSNAAGETIPLAMRIVHLSHDMEAIARLFSPARAIEAARERRDPDLRSGTRGFVRRPRWRMAGAPHGPRPLGRGAGAGADAPSPAGRQRPRCGAGSGGRLHRFEITLHGRPQPALRRGVHGSRAHARLVNGCGDAAAARGAGA